MKGKTHDLNHDLTFSAHTINCVGHSIRSMFRVLGIYNFGSWKKNWVSESLSLLHVSSGGPRNLSKNSLRGWIFAHKTAHLRVVNYGFSCLVNAAAQHSFPKAPDF